MAHIKPFKGFCYNINKPEDLGKFVAPPYDMIEGAMIDELYNKDTANVVRIIQNKVAAQDVATMDRHKRAAEFLSQWMRDGTLLQDKAPSVYLYKQEFNVSIGAKTVSLTRTGVIALVKLVDYDENIVFPHEYTLIGPKIDRYELLQATRSHSELIFGIVPDESKELFSLISQDGPSTCKGRFIDDNGVTHGLYQINDGTRITALQNTLLSKTILIADGHHRYETALKFFRDTKDPRHEYVMMSLVSMADPGLVIRAFHRVLKKYPGTETINVREHLAKYFTMTDLGKAEASALSESLKPGMPFEMLYLDAALMHVYGMELTPNGENYLAQQSHNMSPLWNHLDVSKINSIVVNKIMGLALDGKILHDVMDYVNDASGALEKVMKEPSAFHGVFFIRPVSIDTVNTIVSGKERMPQKSTNFFPKCYSGLVFNSMDMQ